MTNFYIHTHSMNYGLMLYFINKISFAQAYLFERLQFPLLNCFGTFVKKQNKNKQTEKNSGPYFHSPISGPNSVD